MPVGVQAGPVPLEYLRPPIDGSAQVLALAFLVIGHPYAGIEPARELGMRDRCAVDRNVLAACDRGRVQNHIGSARTNGQA
jgi:hypothetical protein